MACHGQPTDHVQRRSEEFAHYLVHNGILHRNVALQWEQRNGEVERKNRSLLKSTMTAKAEGKYWRKELVHYLATYRTTPHIVTGICSAELMFEDLHKDALVA